LVRFERAEIDRWLGSAATDQQSDSVPASEENTPSGIRTNRAAAAEQACGRFISDLTERPANKDTAFKDAKTAVKSIGQLSRKAFERQWAINIRSEWKKAGSRKKE
jgi:hypothetical protein